MSGCYLVYEYPHGSENPTDIAFQQDAEVVGEIPDAQKNLKSEVERTLDVLRAILRTDDPKFKTYFNELLALSRYGLVGLAPQPRQASETLHNLQSRIYDREKGVAISNHMAGLIRSQAVWLVGLFVLTLLCIAGVWVFDGRDAARVHLPMLAIPPALAVALAFSSFVRCRAVTFYELRAIEADRFTPNMKAAFAVVVLLLTGVLLKAELFEIVVGKVRLSAFNTDWLSATVFGMIVGVAQEALVSRIEAVRERAAPPPREGEVRGA